MVDQNGRPAAAAIEKPQTVAELSAIVRDACRTGSSLLLQGGGTHDRFCNAGPEPDAIVDLTGMDSVVDYSPVDLTLAVEGGVRLSAIDSLLAEHNQRLALDMPHRERATIGGTFASGLSGPRRLRYGSLKDMVIGIEAITSRGDVAKAGGMVVKNVSGYELARLHYGAHGAFGIVSRLNLKVLPSPESRVEAQCIFGNPGGAMEAAAAVLVSSLDPAAVYVLSTSPESWTVQVQIEGSSRFARDQAARVIDHVARVGHMSGSETTEVDGRSTPAFDVIADLLEADDSIVARLSAPASNQAALLGRIGVEGGRELLADAGSGLVYVRCPAAPGALEDVIGLGVPVSFLALPDSMKQDLDVFGSVDPAPQRVLGRLKQEYDPDRIFNRGRFLTFL